MTDRADQIQSDYLFARPSFIEGVARLVDVGGSLNAYNGQPTPERADAKALAEDWRAVKHDVSVAFDEIRNEVNEQR